MRLLPLVFLSLLQAVLLAGCRNAVISGRAIDPFGKGIAGAVVTIEGTGFSAATGDDGRYALEFAPGQFRVKVKKENYTSVTLPFNIAESVEVPAADLTMYPIPEEPGLYYLGKGGLEKLPVGKVSVNKFQDALSARFQYMISPSAGISLPEGEARFIDTTGHELQLARTLTRKGMILDVEYHLMMPEEKASGFVTHEVERVGEESLVVRKAKLAVGEFGWVEVTQSPIIGGQEPGESYHAFLVGDAPWFRFIGTFSNQAELDANFDPSAEPRAPYRVHLWHDPSAGVVGHVGYPVQEADTPAGEIVAAKYDVANGAISFKARLWSGSTLEGAESHTIHEFVGKLTDDTLEGTFNQHPEGGSVGQTDRVVLKKESFNEYLDQFDNLASWREEYSVPVLKFRGPKS